MKKFIPGQTANTANVGIKQSLKTRDAAQQCAVLWFEEILNRKLYHDLGYSSINQYAKVELAFSKSHTGEFLALCRTFKRLPKVKEKITDGKLTYTSARVLGTVMDESNQDEWLQLAEEKSRRELEQEVKRAKRLALEKSKRQASLIPLPTKTKTKTRPAAVVTVRVNMEMSPTQFARYEKLWEQVRKQRNASADKVEGLLEMMEAFVAGETEVAGVADVAAEPKRSARADLLPNRKPPVQIHVHQCPDCAQATVQTSKGELLLTKAELAHAQCDCQTSEAGKPNKTSIPPKVHRMVLATARHKCQSPGCSHTQYLEVHHRTPRNCGGTNDPANLQVLCGSCHRLLHATRMTVGGFQVKSPVGVYEYQPR